MDDVNDIIQETYFEFYNAMKKNMRIENIENYIIGIVRNKVKKHYTLLYKLKTVSLFSSISEEIELIDTIKSDVDIEKIIIDTDNTEKIWNYLKSKKIIIQKIFYLYYELDLTIKEISKELNIGESYTKNCLYRTLKELQKFLGKDYD